MPIPDIVCFWLYLIFVIPSILCGIFNLYHLLVDRTLRQALNNHVIIVILFLGLFFNLTDTIYSMHYYRTGYALSATRSFCFMWVYLDYTTTVSILILVAWASVERHILIFHQNWVATPIKCVLIHYVPLIIFSVYPFIYYTIIFFVLPCDLPLDFTQRSCGLVNCDYPTEAIGQWDNIGNNLVPVCIIVIFSVALLVRVWRSKYRVHQRFQWRKYRKMAVQLLLITALYFIIYFPIAILVTIYIAGVLFNGWSDFLFDGYYLCYFTILLTPFVCTASLPELGTKFQNMTRICRRNRRTIGPEVFAVHRLTDERAARITPVAQ
jgi:hypothetical protein